MEIAHSHTTREPMITWDIWDSLTIRLVPQMDLFHLGASTPSFLKVNFNGSIIERGSGGETRFVIRGPDLRFLAVEVGGERV